MWSTFFFIITMLKWSRKGPRARLEGPKELGSIIIPKWKTRFGKNLYKEEKGIFLGQIFPRSAMKVEIQP